MSGRVGRIAALLAVAFVCASGGVAARTADDRDLSAYMGLGTWVDLYDHQVLAKPEAEVAKMAKRGVGTLYLETSNYQMRDDIVNPVRVARFVEAAHANGMQIVAWYLPSLMNIAPDDAAEIARRLDADGDGYIDRQDILDAIHAYYFDEDPESAGSWLLGPLGSDG
jgi:hypothetical protein